VLDNTNGRVVATVRKQFIDEDLFAEQLYCLGKYYNDALIGVETNFSYQPVRHLRSLGYENLYRSKSLSTFKDESESHFGFITTSVSRPIIIANLVSVMRECPELETDRQTLIEMTTFVRHKDGRHSACDGAHDDLVLSCAIARYIAIDFEHNMKIIDTEHEILTNYFSSQTQNSNIFMEW
jgi:phage terminase large subunit